MILTLRVDERLIHGQIIATWLKTLEVTNIVVANDKVAEDEVVQKALKMALPAGQKCLIKSIEDAVRILNDPRGKALRILAITANPQDALKLVQRVKGIPEVNIANYGTMTNADHKDRTTVSAMVSFNEQDRQVVNALIGSGLPVFTQKTPSSAKRKLNKS